MNRHLPALVVVIALVATSALAQCTPYSGEATYDLLIPRLLHATTIGTVTVHVYYPDEGGGVAHVGAQVQQHEGEEHHQSDGCDRLHFGSFDSQPQCMHDVGDFAVAPGEMIVFLVQYDVIGDTPGLIHIRWKGETPPLVQAEVAFWDENPLAGRSDFITLTRRGCL